MSDWKTDIINAMAAFEQVTELAGMPIRQDQWEIEFREAPHCPPPILPAGMKAIYGFWGAGVWLKIGMAGTKSQARYTSQHYNKGSAPSTLAASLANDPRMSDLVEFDQDSPGAWIKTRCNRVK
jgi:hypothetical protein